MSTQEQAPVETPTDVAAPNGADGIDPFLWVELSLSETDAVYGWLMKPAQDGLTALDDPLVSRALTKMRQASDSVRQAVNIRSELHEAGLETEHLSDDELRELAQRLVHTGAPGLLG
jgi:hypothetical protein